MDSHHDSRNHAAAAAPAPPPYTELADAGANRTAERPPPPSSPTQPAAGSGHSSRLQRHNNPFEVPRSLQPAPQSPPGRSSAAPAPPPPNRPVPVLAGGAAAALPPAHGEMAYGHMVYGHTANGHMANGHPAPNGYPAAYGHPAAYTHPSAYGGMPPLPGAFPSDPRGQPSAGPGGYTFRNGSADGDMWQQSPANVIDRGLRAVQRLNPFGSTRNREGDSVPDAAVEDVYLAVMGVTGAGKSSFIKLCTNKNVKIGHNLRSCTTFVEDFQIMYNDRVRLHLIDTPGFDDTHKSDTEVLRDIASWLGTTYSQGIFLSGIIYLHRISDPRMNGGAMRNLHMFKELCGKDCFKSVLLATTFWNSIPYPKAVENEEELKTTEDFWGEMLSLGSTCTRHTGDQASAWNIIDFMIQRRHPFLATIQREMVDGKLDLNQTGAGRKLNADLIELEERHVKKMRDLETSYNQAAKEQDELSMKRIADLHTRLQKEIDEGKEAQQDLVSSLDRINKERAEELENYKSSIETRMKEMTQLREQLDRYQDGSLEAQRQTQIYKQQLEELQESLETVQRRTPGFFETFGSWIVEQVDKLDNWLERVLS